MIKNTDEIRQAANLPDIVQAHGIQLRRSGRSYVGLCPFHTEKTPSFHVHPDKGYYKCFGCGAGGDAIAFLQEHAGMTFLEAIEHIARASRVEVEYDRGFDRSDALDIAATEKKRRAELLDVLKTVSQFYYKQFPLPDAADADSVDAWGRTWKKTTAAAFGISFAGDNEVKKSGFWDENNLLAAGVLADGQFGRYDTFRHRLLFPIHDHTGAVVSFAGRKGPDAKAESPKYLNGPDTLVFSKRKVLYGLFQARKPIHDAGFAYIVEGYPDVLTMHDYGLANTVGVCGTAFTDEQAALLKRHADEAVFVFDSDDAGQRAAKAAVETGLRAGLKVRMLFLDREMGKDPDEILRAHGREAFEAIQPADGLVWRTMLELRKKDDIFQFDVAVNTAAQLLALLDSDTLRDTYVAELSKTSNLGSRAKKLLTDSVKVYRETKLTRKSNLSPKQQNDIIKYGVFEKDNCYFLASDINSTGYQISNFTITPIMLIEGAKRSSRIVAVTNEHGDSFTADIDSDDFVDMTSFRKRVEARGNYLFSGKPEHFLKVKAKIYSECKTCYPITVLGWHKAGFWAWGNGLSNGNGFHAVNEYGIVEHEKVRYFLPAFSKIHADLKSDDDDTNWEDERNFVLRPDLPCISFRDWTERMVAVHNGNGMLAVTYYLASCFRDIIYSRFSFFPHLNLFGPSGSGKSYLAWSLASMYGKPKQPFHLVHGTNVCFFRRLAQVRNGISWMDEYSNDIDVRRAEALKAAYDGSGHEKGVMSQDNKTITTRTNSALIISGQQMPTKDIAILKRCISLNFNSGKNDADSRKKGEELKAIEGSGQLAAITGSVQKYRDLVAEKFGTTFDAVRAEIAPALASYSIEDRILNNHLIPLVAYQILADSLDFAFPWTALRDFTVENIIRQSESIYTEDELSIFWRMVEFLISSHVARHGDDLLVEMQNAERFRGKSDKSSDDAVIIRFPSDKRLVYIHFARIHTEYMERHKRIRGKAGLELGALTYYLQNSDAYLGEKKAKKFRGKARRCLVFDADLLPVDFALTLEALKEVDDLPFLPEPSPEAVENVTEKLPF